MQNPAMPDQRICANCGTPAQVGEQFCGECGAPLPPANPGAAGNYQTNMPPPSYPVAAPLGGYQSGGPLAPPPYQTQPVAQPQVKRSNNSMPLIIGGLVVVLAIAAVVIALVLGGNKTNNVTNNTATNTTNTTTPNGGNSGNTANGATDNVSLLQQAVTSMKQAKSYHLEVAGTSDSTPLTLSGDIDIANNNSKLLVTTSGQTIAVIIVGSDTYVSTDNGSTFVKSDSAATLVSGLNEFTAIWNNINDSDINSSSLSDGSPATETIDGVNTKHMVTSAGGFGSAAGDTSGTVDLWVATDGSSVLQMKINGTSSGTTSNLTFKWSNLNSQFNIQAPPSN